MRSTHRRVIARKQSEGMAGTTGLELATSGVTDLHSGPVKSWTYRCYEQLASAKLWHGMPLNAPIRHIHFTPATRGF